MNVGHGEKIIINEDIKNICGVYRQYVILIIDILLLSWRHPEAIHFYM